MKKIIDSIKYIKAKDILSVLIFLVVLIPALIFKLINKLRKKELWLITERENTASDNAYHFYKYLKINHPEIYSFYAIDKKCKEYKNVAKFGNIIQYGGLKHWIFYIASDKKISAHKAGNPAPALFYVLHVYLNLFNNRIFLQHGIIKDMCECFIYKNTKFKIFICGAKDEYEYIKEKYGYPENSVKYTGLARFDNLHDNKVDLKKILIIPTWRSWLGREENKLGKHIEFTQTAFYQNWQKILENEKFINYIETNNITVYFYPHINMKKYLKFFKINSKNIVAINDEINIQDLLKETSLMITDYSSVYMDFAYMRKPVIYYQFDKEEYRKKHWKQGYFVYEKNGFGDVLTNVNDVVNKTIYYIDNNYEIEPEYLERMKKFFELRDNKNCERIFNSIK